MGYQRDDDLYFYHYHMMQELSLVENFVNNELQVSPDLEEYERYIQALEEE